MFELIAQTEHFYLIDKHPGVGFHREDGDVALIDALRERLGDTALWPVHRLDKVTSGLLLFARSAAAARALGEDLAEHRLDKFYLALSARKPSKKQGTVKGDMVKARGGAWPPRRSSRPSPSSFRGRCSRASACSCCVRSPGAPTSCAWR